MRDQNKTLRQRCEDLYEKLNEAVNRQESVDRLYDFVRSEIAIKKEARFKHLKRGSTYWTAGAGLAQCAAPIEDQTPVIIYQSEDDGSFYVRPASEFYDGRFVKLDDT